MNEENSVTDNIADPAADIKDNPPPQNESKKIKPLIILAAVVLVVLAVIISLYFSFSQKRNSLSNPNRVITYSTPAPTSTTIPKIPLFPELTWQSTTHESGSISYDFKDSMLYWNNSPVKNLTITGKEWTAAQQNISNQQLEDSLSKFTGYYDSGLSGNGWKDKITYKDNNLMTISASGPTGDVWGYLYALGDNLSITLLSTNVKYAATNKQPLSCPCDATYRIFLSDPISISKIGE